MNNIIGLIRENVLKPGGFSKKDCRLSRLPCQTAHLIRRILTAVHA